MRLDAHTLIGLCAAWHLAGCSTPPGATTDGDTSTTTGPMPVTTTTTTEAPPTTTEAPPVTTGGTTGEQLPADCEVVVAELTKQYEQFCACPSLAGNYPDIATCVFENVGAWVGCECAQFAKDPESPGFVGCLAAATVEYTKCVAPLTCEQMEGGIDCGEPFDACGEPSKATLGAVHIECYMDPVFMCGSGEQIPEYHTCDAEADCADMSDEADAVCRFTCGSGEKIENYRVCDGEVDCVDMSDEAPAMCLFTCDGDE